jgi:DNA-directed RNA polymerase beta' subunit
MSVVSKEINGINQTDMFTDGQATRGGLLDPRLGTTDFNTICATCGLVPGECHGHTGHTDLAEPVFHFGYLEVLKNVLSCVCLRCAKLLIYKTEDEIQQMLTTTKRGKNRFMEIRKLTSNITYCARTDQNCGVPVPKIKKDVKKGSGVIQLVAITNLQNISSEEGGQSSLDKKKQIREIITPRMAYDILKNVSDNDYRIMGFDPSISRPEDFIIKYFPIPPIAIRPSVKMSISSTTNYEDMLTSKLVDILKTNIRIRKQMDKEPSSGEEPKYLNENVQLLQYHIATFFDNDNMSLPKSEQKSGGRPTKSISDRIRGKQGRIRGNLMGKRTDFSARTVITSDPNLSLDELGVPIKIAMNITFPEVVTPYNIEEMTKLVKNARYVYPGANFVIPENSIDGKKYTIDLRYRKKGIKLRPGDIVERHIKDGDPVLFNRQPSLHKLSMMCHKVKVINDDKLQTFRINVSVTTPYNADFDGDEMNMFIPQSIQTQLELAHIADVSKQIITPRYSTPIIQLKQDTVLGTYQMTETKSLVRWHDAMNILMNCKNIDYSNVIKEDIDTHKLFSLIIPPLINVVDGDKLSIINSSLQKGIISGSVLNSKIISYSWDRHGPKLTKDFIDNSQKLIINFLLQDGFTVGLGDAIISKVDKDEVRKFMQEKVLEVQHLITEIENYPDLLDPDTFEQQIYSFLSTVKGDVPKMVMKKLNTDNHFYGMIASGAKGKDLNLGQIVGGLGQDILKFSRIEKKVNNRTLVHFCQNDDTAEARGFITNSYFDGLDPHEFYFHHMTGREGIIDTAIKTADTGYLQRKLIKGMEDVYIAYDGTVRSGNNVIIQMLYGDSHLDQTMQKLVKFNILSWGDKKIEEKCKFTDSEVEEVVKKLKYNQTKATEFKEFNNEIIDTMIQFRDDFRALQEKAKLNNVTLKELYYQPANYSRIIEDAKNTLTTESTPLDPLYVISEIERMMDPRVCRLVCIRADETEDSPKYDNQRKSKYLFQIALYEYLGPKRCLYEYNFNKEKFDQVIKEIVRSFNNSTVQPGEMVGVVASQSLGEPLTQMTLNSVDWNDRILYQNTNKVTNVKPIGELIDDLMNSDKENLKKIKDKPESTPTDTDYLDISSLNYQVPTVDENGKTSWKLIEAITRHLPGHDGKLVKIKTKFGREVSATKSKSFLTLVNGKLVDTNGSEIKIGDRLPIDMEYFNKNEKLEEKYKFNNVYMDEIVEMTFVKPSHEKVYDLTVADTRNFTMADGLCMRDTFHQTGSGVAGMQGVPRFRELLSYTKNPHTPYMVIYMTEENRSNKDHAHRIKSTLKYTILVELAEQLDIIYDPDAKASMTSYYNTDDIDKDSVFFLNNMSSTNVDNMPWLFRVTLSKENIVENEITMLDIKSKFISFWNNYYSDISSLKKPEKDVIQKILHGCIMTSYDSSDSLVVHFRFELSNVDNQILLNLQDILLNKFNIKGNEKITKITKIDNQQYITYSHDDKNIETKKEWVIYTEGIDINSIRKLIGVDVNRTYCNDINIIYQTFGIEAARCALIKEFENVFDGNNVNHTHIALLGDVMTNNGGITSIDRHGINRLDTDPMGRASFEKTIEQLLNAAAFNEVDYLRGVSSRIMIGRCIKGGTGLCDLIIDTEMLENSELDDTKDVKTFGSDFISLKASTLLDDLMNNSTKNIFMPY